MSKIKIDVKRVHIKKGVCRDSRKCPIANALVAQGMIEPSVSCIGIYFKLASGTIVRSKPTKKMRKFIERFDNEGSGAVKPTSFTLLY